MKQTRHIKPGSFAESEFPQHITDVVPARSLADILNAIDANQPKRVLTAEEALALAINHEVDIRGNYLILTDTIMVSGYPSARHHGVHAYPSVPGSLRRVLESSGFTDGALSELTRDHRFDHNPEHLLEALTHADHHRVPIRRFDSRYADFIRKMSASGDGTLPLDQLHLYHATGVKPSGLPRHAHEKPAVHLLGVAPYSQYPGVHIVPITPAYLGSLLASTSKSTPIVHLLFTEDNPENVYTEDPVDEC